jgi:hypothetical protein
MSNVEPSMVVLVQLIPVTGHGATTVPTHAPDALHVSPVVHAMVSLHASPVCITSEYDIVASLQTYAAHALEGPGGAGGLPAMHPRVSAPDVVGAQRSVPVHQRPSSQTESVATCDATPALHRSVVHEYISLGTNESSFTARHPAVGSQLSRVHGLPSLHATALPPVHAPARHCCPARHMLVAHALPSARLVNVHDPPTRLSVVHGLLSLQTGVKHSAIPAVTRHA